MCVRMWVWHKNGSYDGWMRNDTTYNPNQNKNTRLEVSYRWECRQNTPNPELKDSQRVKNEEMRRWKLGHVMINI